MAVFLAGLLTGLLIAGILGFYYWWRNKPAKEQLAEMIAKQKLKEVANEIKKSANPNVPNDVDGMSDMLDSIGGNRRKRK